MTIKRFAFFGALLLLLIVLIFTYFKSGGKERIKQSPVSPSPEISLPSEEQKEKKTIVLFFLSEEDSLLHPEEREIYAYPSIVHEAKQTIEELINGSKNGHLSPLPPQTKLRELFLTKKGVAYVDLSKDFQTAHPSGSSAEMLTIYSIVNSLTYNFKSVKEVFLLVDGGEKETLGGHINLSRPFVPLYSLIAE